MASHVQLVFIPSMDEVIQDLLLFSFVVVHILNTVVRHAAVSSEVLCLIQMM